MDREKKTPCNGYRGGNSM